MALLFRGESRWKIFCNPLFWLKVAEIIIPLFMFPFCMTYQDQGNLHTKNRVNWFNITVKYPFKYYENVTAVYTNEDIPPKFSFDSAINVCVQVFVIVAIVSIGVALGMVVLSFIVHKTGSLASSVMYAEIFSAIVVAFLLVISTSLWLYNLFTLKQEVEGELNSYATFAKRSCMQDGGTEQKCEPIKTYPDYTPLFVSVGFGFVTFLVWLANIVYVYQDLLTPAQEDANGNNALIWAQELPETSVRIDPSGSS